MSRRPRIGITTSFQDNEQRLAVDYVLAVESAGGLPLPAPMASSASAIAAFAQLLDGLIITGGPAITEGLIGTLPDDLHETDITRSEADRFLLDLATARGLPILGICYGMQLVNASRGGTIYADAEQQIDSARVHSEKRGATTHPISILPGTHLHRILDKTHTGVNSRHVQAVATVGEHLRVSATAEDGVIEALESFDGLFIGVQYHPERMGDDGLPLFRNLVRQARERSELDTPVFA